MYLLHQNVYMDKLSSMLDVTPSATSKARRIFLIYSSFAIVLGWAFSYVFLYLYFKYDDGYFSVADLQFEYNQNNSAKKKDLHNVEHTIQGDWIDMSGQEQMKSDDTVVEYTVESNDNQISAPMNFEPWEQTAFEEIRHSFNYYRIKNEK